ncbi:TniQ family protein [Bacillus sp. FJAT-27445]|uniref:TniQ family protein n=1 Tax=Bacillus sp. FJAT-27445 TaxID=1679166 RepID=UPI000743230A|nr:TniQ family protein [Bacillus sp. FJAT-27445]
MLFYPEPYPNETLLSLIGRMANEHLMENPKWIFKTIEAQTSLKIGENLINWVTDEVLKEISVFLGISQEVVYSLTFVRHLEMLGFEVENKEKNQWFLYSKTRYCPICVGEKNYQRKNWVICQSIMCRKHNVYLLDKCLDCQNIISTNEIIQNKCSKCHTVLSNSVSVKCDEPLFNFYQEIIDSAILNNLFVYKHTWIKDSQTFLKVLEFLSLWVAQLLNSKDLSIPSLGIIYDGKALERNHLKNSKTIEQTICLYTHTFNIINNWPEEFYSFLDNAEKKEVEYISFIRNGIPKLLGTPLWEISNELTNYIAKQKALIKGNDFIRSDEIRFYNNKFNGSIIHSNLINNHKVIYKGQQFDFIDKGEFFIFVDNYKTSYSKEELRDFWGTSARATLSILNSKMLSNSFSYCCGSSSPWVIPNNSIEHLNQILAANSTLSSSLINPLTFNQIMLWAGPDKATILLEGMINKEVQFHYSGKLSETILDKRECYYFIKRKVLQLCSNSCQISYRDLIFILGIKKSDIVFWIKCGRFGDIDSNSTGIPIKNYLMFTNLYITTYELAFHLNLKIKQVITKHRMGKIKSISGPNLKDGKRLLFFKGKLNLT